MNKEQGQQAVTTLSQVAESSDAENCHYFYVKCAKVSEAPHKIHKYTTNGMVELEN